ncbi:phosphatidylserine synthase 2 [Sanghuangporus baumii]|uniref:Phosphatidylserine synthase 2 n=1 Tax=Sanghuangporus baumii TaxID=108892 RepID=A0A9Q5HQ36_SANBA|nr:phosphatidylserine synthase 2 [Sanghuangporus baumii]
MSAEQAVSNRDEGELPAMSPIEDSDSGFLSPPETEPNPGLNGAPVRWYDADRNEPYTKIEPFAERHDTSVEFFYHPLTLSALAVGMALMAYVATTEDLLAEGKDKRRLGVYAAISFFLLFSTLQFRDGPFVRPHPAFWRIVLGVNLLYELALVFLLFQDLGTARQMLKHIDPNLGVPLPEKSYADNCDFTTSNILGAIDIFCLAHALGWFGKALILRDYWFCWILSIAFELAEYSLQHQLPNFAECWWDHFSPHDFTAFKWEGTASFHSYVTVVLLLAVFLAAELNPFYLKACAHTNDLGIRLIPCLGLALDGTKPSNCYLKACGHFHMWTPSGEGAVSIYRGLQESEADGFSRLAASCYSRDRDSGDQKVEQEPVSRALPETC